MVQSKLIIAAVIAAVAFGAGWQVQTWRYDSKLLEQQGLVEEARDRVAVVEAKSAEVQVVVKYKEKVITRDVIKYVQDPDRSVCVYDAERVRIKTNILRAADTRSKATD